MNGKDGKHMTYTWDNGRERQSCNKKHKEEGQRPANNERTVPA
jgi:hypothetical protein